MVLALAVSLLAVSLAVVVAWGRLRRAGAVGGQQVGPTQLHVVVQVHPELSRGAGVQVLLEQVDLMWGTKEQGQEQN